LQIWNLTEAFYGQAEYLTLSHRRKRMSPRKYFWHELVCAALFSMAAVAGAQGNGQSGVRFLPVESNPKLDRTGEPQHGKASYYGKTFYGRTMADGTPMDPEANIAASRTLPLGSIVEVTNLKNGKKEVVEIRDRGPYVDGRIIDLSPKIAEQLDMMEEGVVQVVVTPIAVPQRDGSISTGSGATQEASAAE
jgi:rare lipoprotein A